MRYRPRPFPFCISNLLGYRLDSARLPLRGLLDLFLNSNLSPLLRDGHFHQDRSHYADTIPNLTRGLSTSFGFSSSSGSLRISFCLYAGFVPSFEARSDHSLPYFNTATLQDESFGLCTANSNAFLYSPHISQQI